MVLQSVFYQGSLEKQMPGGCTVDRNDPWPLFFLEWGSCDRRTSDPDGICCIFRGQAGLPAYSSGDSGFLYAAVKNFRKRQCGLPGCLFWLSGRG